MCPETQAKWDIAYVDWLWRMLATDLLNPDKPLPMMDLSWMESKKVTDEVV